MKKIYKAVICDLDGTLLNSSHTISETTKDVIKKIVDKGIKFYIATGRHHMDATVFKKMLGLNSFLISSNGAQVHDENNEEIFSVIIPKDVTAEIINLTVDSDIHKNIFSGDEWLVEKPLSEAHEFHKESGFIHTVVPSFQAVKNRDITKFFFISEDVEKLSVFSREIHEKFQDKVAITLSLESCLEVMNRGVSKGEAIKKMLHLEGLSPEEAVAFGDGMNDLEMLSTVGRGFIMGNHNPSLKKALPHNEVIETNDNDGVAKKLSELFL
ncbi:MAG: Cof-type HAD-IIB family hydrolase [Fusobacteriaceae bacterium]